MKKLILFIGCLYCLSLSATTYYVSTSGNNSANGTTTATPWQTLTKVNSVNFNAGDIILFKRGDTWTGDSLVITRSGSSGSHITFGAYGTGMPPVLSGFTTISAWTDQGNNIWQSTNAVSGLNTCNMVTFNGVNVPMGRIPKSTASNGGYYNIDSHNGGTSITSNSLTGNPNWTGAMVVSRVYNWTVDRSIITSQTGSTINFGAIGTPNDGNGFFIQGDLKCCTQQNDWYYNRSTKKLNVYSTSQPSNVKIASIERVVTIQANYIDFTDINIIGGNGCGIWGQSSNNHIIIKNSTINNIGLVGIYLNSSYTTIQDDSIMNVNCTAIGHRFGTLNLFSRNYIHNIGIYLGMRIETYYVSDYGAIQIEEPVSTIIEYNKVINTGQNGISFYGDTMLIRYNFVDSFSTCLDDAGGIYTYSGSGRAAMKRVRIYNNICTNGIGTPYGVYYKSGSAGIYLDEQSTNVEVFNNSVANTYLYGIQCNVNAGYISFHGNTVFNGSSYQLFESYSSGAAAPTHDSIYNNILVAKYSGQTSEDWQRCLGFWWDSKNGVDGKTVYANAHYLDYNYYTRPIAETNVVYGNGSNYTLATWKTFTGKESHTTKATQTISNTNNIQFIYNETTSNKTVTLAQPMIDVKGVQYNSIIVLSPFTSAVLMVDNNPSGGGVIIPPSVDYGKGKFIRYQGKMIRYHGKGIIK